MEFLDLPFDEMTMVEKHNRAKYFFPVVHFIKAKNSVVASFNKMCINQFGNAKYLKIYGNAEYLVFVPTNTVDHHCYKITYNRTTNPVVVSRSFVRFAVADKTYKVYQTQKGFAIKLNEPILGRKE